MAICLHYRPRLAGHRIDCGRIVLALAHCNYATTPSPRISCTECEGLNKESQTGEKLTEIAFGWVLLHLERLPVNAEVRLRFILKMLLENFLPILGLPQKDLL